jgi:hypothetical protein
MRTLHARRPVEGFAAHRCLCCADWTQRGHRLHALPAHRNRCSRLLHRLADARTMDPSRWRRPRRANLRCRAGAPSRRRNALRVCSRNGGHTGSSFSDSTRMLCRNWRPVVHQHTSGMRAVIEPDPAASAVASSASRKSCPSRSVEPIRQFACVGNGGQRAQDLVRATTVVAAAGNIECGPQEWANWRPCLPASGACTTGQWPLRVAMR